MTTEIDSRFLARQNDRILAELTDMRGNIMLVSHDNARMRDDMNVLTAMVIRLEHSQQRTHDEVRSVYAQLQRLTKPASDDVIDP